MLRDPLFFQNVFLWYQFQFRFLPNVACWREIVDVDGDTVGVLAAARRVHQDLRASISSVGDIPSFHRNHHKN